MLLLQTAAQAVAAANSVPVVDPSVTDWFNGIADQAGLAFITVGVMNYLKKAKWFPALNAINEKVTRRVSTIVAIVAAVGVQIHLTGSWTAGWTCSPCTVPPVHAIYTSIAKMFGQKYGQDFLYHNTQSPQPVISVPAPPMDMVGKPLQEHPIDG